MTHYSSEFHKLTDRYTNVGDIINDPHAGALAFAADMNKEDFVNLQIKSFTIQEAILKEPVVIDMEIDGVKERVPLSHPQTGQPLYYSDFLNDRSGPKFGGYLHDGAANELIESSMDQDATTDLIANQIEKTKAHCEAHGLAVPDEAAITQSASILARPHETQRKLSDFDLTAHSIDTLKDAIANAVEEKMGLTAKGEKLPPHIRHDVGTVAWEEGGAISTNLVKESMETGTDYCSLVKQQEHANPKSAEYTHMLISGPGQKMFELGLPNIENDRSAAETDTYYGLGVPFMGAEVREWKGDSDLYEKGQLVLTTQLYQDWQEGRINEDTIDNYLDGDAKKHHGKFELGDVICDSISHYGTSFSHDKNMDNTLPELQAAVGEALLTEVQAQVNEAHPSLNRADNFDKVLETLETRKADFAPEAEARPFDDVVSAYKENSAFIETYQMSEECAKKIGQSQLFQRSEGKEGKEIGNISDVSPMLGKSNLQTQITSLSLMINVPRWVDNVADYTSIEHTSSLITPEQFQESINKRSYSYSAEIDGVEIQGTGAREAKGWSNISLEEAEQRIDTFQQGVQELYSHMDPVYFEKVGELKEAIQAEQEADRTGSKEAAWKASRQMDVTWELQEYMQEMVQEKFPELHAKMNEMTQGQPEQLYSALVGEVGSSIRFGLQREEKAKAKEKVAVKAAEQEEVQAVAQAPEKVEEQPVKASEPVKEEEPQAAEKEDVHSSQKPVDVADIKPSKGVASLIARFSGAGKEQEAEQAKPTADVVKPKKGIAGLIAKFSGGDKDQSQAEQAEPKQVESKPHSSQEPVDISDIKPSVNVKAQAEQINAKQTTVPKGMEAALQEFQSLGGNGFALDAPESSKPVQEQSEKQEQSQSHGGKKTIGKFTEMVNSQSAQQSHGMGKGT